MNTQQSAAASAMSNTSPGADAPKPAAVNTQQPCPNCQKMAEMMGPGCGMCYSCCMMAKTPGAGT